MSARPSLARLRESRWVKRAAAWRQPRTVSAAGWLADERAAAGAMERQLTRADAVLATRFGPGREPWSAGRCNICGHRTAFVHLQERVFRESFVCSVCYATARYRAMARAVLRAIGDMTGATYDALTDLPRRGPTPIRVLDTQVPFSSPPHAAYLLPTVLARFDWIDVATSQYKPQHPWGTPLAPNRTNQNLEDLTYPDAHFDLLLTSDVMEHVRLYQRAHAEIFRVIRPGGYYVFTVPCFRSGFSHIERVRVHDPDDPGKDEHLLPPEYHGSADAEEQATGGVLSYRAFGTELDSELTDLGFDVLYLDDRDPGHGLYDSEVFICQRG